MKKTSKIMVVLMVAILLMIPCISMASVQDTDTKINDLYYRILNEENKTVELTGVYNSEFKNKIDVPSSVEIGGKTYTVARIGDGAFSLCSTLTSITLPNTIKTIGRQAFYETAIETITIPNGVISIEYRAFSNCNVLKSINLPNTITSMGESAFSSCYQLKNITIPSSLTTIPQGAFFGTGIETITIPNTVTSIGASAFSGCSKLKSIVIPNGITQINANTFNACYNLENITIPKSVNAIAYNAFVMNVNSVNKPLEKIVINTYSGAYAETFAKENNFKYKLLDVKEPEAPIDNTKVGFVTIGGNGNTLSGAEIPKTENVYREMADFLKDKGYKTVHCAYELTATGNVQDGVELTFDIGTANNGKAVMILHKKSNGNYETFERIVENGKVKITVTEFSPFMVAIAENKPSIGNNQGSNSTDNILDGKTERTGTIEQTPTEVVKESIGAKEMKAKTDNEPYTGTRDYTIVATILAIVSLAGIIVLKLKK